MQAEEVKYLAKHAPDDSDDADHEWYVEFAEDGLSVQWNGLREAEAKAICFALQAIRNGRLLVASDLSLEASTHALVEEGSFCHEIYTGPVEGIS